MSKVIRKGRFGVRYASDRDHKRHGWIFKNLDTIRQAVDAADVFLMENDLNYVLLEIVDSDGNEVDTVSRENDTPEQPKCDWCGELSSKLLKIDFLALCPDCQK